MRIEFASKTVVPLMGLLISTALLRTDPGAGKHLAVLSLSSWVVFQKTESPAE
jgi:hypothetical protein